MSAVLRNALNADQVPSIDELVNRVRELGPLLEQRAATTETDRRVSADTSHRLIEAGLMRLGQPRRFGGYEYGPSAILQVGFELGRHCGSTAWCAMVANVSAWLAAYWPADAQQDVWGVKSDHLVMGTFVPTGQCSATDGGYLIHGRWPFASNCDNSNWFFLSAVLPPIDGQSPGVGWFMVPGDQIEIDQNSWHVAGMQGTGSKTLLATQPLFVPSHRVIRFSDVVQGTTPGRSIEDNTMARFGFATLGAATLVAPMLGMAQGALDWFIAAMKNKVKTSLKSGAPTTAAHSPHTQVRIGEASAAIDSAMALLMADLTAAETKIYGGGELSVHERIKVRRDIGFAARQAQVAVNTLFEGAGAASASLDMPIQRLWRDVNAAGRHASLDVQAIYGVVGQEAFGFHPVGQY